MRLWPVASAIVAMCVLSACDDGGSDITPQPTPSSATATTGAPATEPSDEPTPEPSEEPTAAGDSGDTDQFVTVVREQLPDVADGRTDDEIAAVATTACDGLGDGASADDITAAAQSLGTLDAEATDQATARELVKLAIDTVCLDQAARVDEF